MYAPTVFTFPLNSQFNFFFFINKVLLFMEISCKERGAILYSVLVFSFSWSSLWSEHAEFHHLINYMSQTGQYLLSHFNFTSSTYTRKLSYLWDELCVFISPSVFLLATGCFLLFCQSFIQIILQSLFFCWNCILIHDYAAGEVAVKLIP